MQRVAVSETCSLATGMSAPHSSQVPKSGECRRSMACSTSRSSLLSRAAAAAFSNGLPDERHPACIGRVDALPFLAKQQRLTFARVGVIDPVSLADYEAHGGLAGLRAALALPPADVESFLARQERRPQRALPSIPPVLARG